MTSELNLTELQKELDRTRLMYSACKGMSPWDVARLSTSGQRARREALERLERQGKALSAQLEQLKQQGKSDE